MYSLQSFLFPLLFTYSACFRHDSFRLFFVGDAPFRVSGPRCRKSCLGEFDHGLIARNTKRGDAMRRLLIGVFYKLRDKERSKESAYVLVGFLARPFVSFVSHIARYAPSSTDKSSSLRNQKSTQPNF